MLPSNGKLLILTAMLAVLSCTAQATTRTAASCSQSDVQAALDLAQDGDSVLIPSGAAAWTRPVTLEAPKAITIQGAGIEPDHHQ